MSESPLAVARACFEAHVAKDRAAIEALIAGDYRFTSAADEAPEGGFIDNDGQRHA